MFLNHLRKLIRNNNIKVKHKMNVFTQKLNPVTGKCDWEVQDENYDYHQEVARSAFADMLHDTERNQKYEAALKVAIDHIHSLGKKANVLDIGTGTGLLSMMAVRNGADSVVACEAFKPMSECASKIIEANGCNERIKIVPKRSTDLIVGENGDLEVRANILVTEVFDTELIGEGALGTFKHAHEKLLEKDCIVVPQSATVYVQIIDSPIIQQWNRLKDVFDDEGELILKVPNSVKNCLGAAAVHDLQLSQVSSNFFNSIVKPQPVFGFDWSGKTPFIFDRSNINTIKAQRAGTVQGVFMWWDLIMDINNAIILSCAPYWAHPNHPTKPSEIPWRDHWMQAVYYFPKEVNVLENEEINLISCHDEYSLWFNIKKDLKLTDLDYSSPFCDCGLHISYSRSRIGQLNDTKRNKKYLNFLQKNIDQHSIILVASNGFYPALSAVKFGAKKVIVYEDNLMSKNFMINFVKFNNLENVAVVDDLGNLAEHLGGEKVKLVLGEPYFISSIIPWHNLLFAYLLRECKSFLADEVKLCPKKAVIKSVAVEFRDLHKIRAPLRSCEGFNMDAFDDLIKASSDISDENVEAQPLWEYPGTAQSEEVQLAEIQFQHFNYSATLEADGIYKLQQPGQCNGIAFWVDWYLDGSEKNIVTTGPIEPTKIGEDIVWDMHTRQGVYLFSMDTISSEVKYKFKFDAVTGSISFSIC